MKINVAYIEDNRTDIELFKVILESSDQADFNLTVTDTLKELDGLIFESDVIVSDYNLRGFDGLDVLKFIRERNNQIPVIIFSSTIGEEKAVELIRVGATDFVLKDNINKIPYSILRGYNEYKLLNEREQIKMEVHEKDVMFTTLFNSQADLIILLNREGIITNANDAFCQFFNVSCKNIIGEPESLFIPNHENLMANEQVLNTEKPYSYVLDIQDPMEGRKILEALKSPFRFRGKVSGLVAVIRDVTEKRLLEEEKAKDRFILQQAEKQSLIGSFELDPDNDILLVSKNFCKLVNISADKNTISVKKLIEIVHPDDQLIFSDKLYGAMEGEKAFELEHRYVPFGSLDSDFRYSKTVINPHNNLNGLVFYGTIQDVTEERMTKMAILKIQDEERERISRELHDNIGQKLSATSIFMNMENFDRQKVKGLIDESIEIIRSISRVLTTSNLADSNFWEAVEYLIDNTPIADKVQFEYQVDDDLIPKFTGEQLYRIIQEILNNASKYSQASKVVLLISSNNKLLTLEYRDNGIGFDPDTTRLGNGVRNMKERTRFCNGEFLIDSRPKAGTTIHINIPLYHDQENITS